jgi:hypothetical protein
MMKSSSLRREGKKKMNANPNGPPQGVQPRKLSSSEIDLLASQASEREAVSIDQEDKQIDAGMLTRAKATPEERELRIRHTSERARMEMEMSNKMFDVQEVIKLQNRAVLLRHQAEKDQLVAEQKSKNQG